MQTIPLLISFFALSIASMDFALAIVLNHRERKNWTAWFIVLLSSLLGLALLFSLDQFSSLFYTGTARFVLHLVWKVFFIADSTFLVVVICFFGNWLIARPMSFLEKFLAYFLGAGFLSLSILNQVFALPSIVRAQYLIAAISIFYVVIVMLATYQKIENKKVKVVVLTVSIVSFSVCPLMIAANIWPDMGNMLIPIVGLAYFIVFLVFLYVAISKEDKEAVKDSTNDLLTLDDVAQYGITGRELEVIRLIKQGLTNKEIASYLSISVNTVNNHIANIFSKTNVRSRIDLLNLLQKASW